MSAAAARRRKQLAARAANGDAIASKLEKLLEDASDEPTAYEALQLAQSQVRKAVNTGKFKEALELGYTASLALLNKKKVSVASQLLHLLVQVLRETHQEATDEWIGRLVELHSAYQSGLEGEASSTEKTRLLRLQREWLRKCVSWSNELGPLRFGDPKLYELLGDQCWMLPAGGGGEGEEAEDSRADIMADAVQAMVLAEQPNKILAWLSQLPKPTKAELKLNHTCPPADRDALFTRAIIIFCAVENLRDATTLFQGYADKVEERTADTLTKSYMKKEDGQAPSHLIFCSMLLSVCQKDARTGPLFTWLMRSFKKELDGLVKPTLVQGYTTKIGKVYFNIQPPPSMMSMMENMMGMMGGGGGMNPAMMQAALAQAQGM